MISKLTINPAIRLSFGLAMFTVSVLLFAELFGLVPDQDKYVLDARKKVCESLAVQLSVSATKHDSAFMQDTLNHFVNRNKDVIAASMSTKNGLILAQYGVFSKSFDPDTRTVSTMDLVIVPIYEGEKKWGTVNVEFGGILSSGIIDGIQQSGYGPLLLMLLSCSIGFYLILRRTLKVLDPASVVPDRVINAFNTMSEGVLIIDRKQQIMMANDELARKTDKDANALVGMDIDSLNWRMPVDDVDTPFPWKTALETGIKQVDVSMEISTVSNGVRTLSVNCAPILEDNDLIRGAMITIDDITNVHETNLVLEKTVDDLVEHQSEITRKNIELETLATRDTLTGCYNRRAFFDKFENLMHSAINSEVPLACIMADIDHFKSVNDNYGHAVGDEVIQMFADVLNSSQRDNVIIGRYGGEEFCILLPDTGIKIASLVAERLRSNIQQSRIGTHDTLKITASFGVAELIKSDLVPSDVINRADQALYVSKNKGRNRVSLWTPETAKILSAASGSTIESNIDTTQPDSKTNKYAPEPENSRKKNALVSGTDNTPPALIDEISGLPAQSLFEDRLAQSIAMAERMDTITVVSIININMFSRINTAMGEHVGNAFLREVGNRLKSIIRRSDTVASLLTPGYASPSMSRLRGDEFALIFSGLKDIESISYIVSRLQEKLRGKVEVGDKSFFINTSIGVSLYPNDGDSAAVLIDHARSAQKHTRLAGDTSIQFYSHDINEQVVYQMQIEVDMLNALENQQFLMVYQPKLDLRTGDVVSAEALIRWQHPTRGIIAPQEFIPIAEKNGLIVEIGKWILSDVCEQTRKWVDMGIDDLCVSVNVSAIEFIRPDFVAGVKETLKQAGLNARHLEIEITETALLSDMAKVQKTIQELQYLGVTLTLDDFGTGYSSFSYLGKLDFTSIKLERSFLLEALESERSRVLYESVVSMVQHTGLLVITEGIETEEQFDFVKSLGVDEVQGFLISKPLEAQAITGMITGEQGISGKAAGM